MDKRKSIKTVTEEPEWMKSLPGDATLNSRDIKSLFNIRSKILDVTYHVSVGHFPKPVRPALHRVSGYSNFRISSSRPNIWTVSDLRKWFKHCKSLIENEAKNEQK